jgi:hypothetical protein
MIGGVLTYLEQNIKDPIYRKILMNVYLKYGPAYMLSILTEPPKNGNNDFDSDSYYPALLRDVEYSPNEYTLYTIIDTIPQGKFSSFSYYFEYTGAPAYMLVQFNFNSASHRITANYRSIAWDGNSYSEYGTFLVPNKNVQVNIGWSHDDHLLIEWYVDGEHIRLMDMTQIFQSYHSEDMIEMQTSCLYDVGIEDVTMNFYYPNKVFASSEFLNNIL